MIIFDNMLYFVCYELHTILSPTSKAMCLVISNNRKLVCSGAWCMCETYLWQVHRPDLSQLYCSVCILLCK